MRPKRHRRALLLGGIFLSPLVVSLIVPSVVAHGPGPLHAASFGDPSQGPWQPSWTGRTWIRRTQNDTQNTTGRAEGTIHAFFDPAALELAHATVNATSPTFRITFRCDTDWISAERCGRAEAAFVRAADRISASLSLSVPIDVSAAFESFCGRRNAKSDPTCKNTNGVLGSASPAAFYDFADQEALQYGADGSYLYPTALAKQFMDLDTIAPQGIDIAARFNADFAWWIDAQTDGDLLASEYDLEEAITHELLHGMGFISSWFAWLGPDEAVLTPSYVARDDNGIYLGFAKEYIFNKFVADNVNGEWMSTWSEAVSRGVGTSVPITADWTRWIEAFKATAAYNLTKHLFQVAQSDHGLAFWYNSTVSGTIEKATLYTPEVYSGGSSVSHLDTTVYEAGEDWLMRPYAISGAKVDDIRPRSIKGSGTIGDTTLGILKTLGYRTVWDGEEPERPRLKKRKDRTPQGRIHVPPPMT